jgi:dual specificity tyrosine-phosphorylation-regulated kinase 2/3/4
MQKQSDPSLRTRNQLPTIAGSPSVGTHTSPASKDAAREPFPLSLINTLSGQPKETPTKIPRISSRTSALGTPPPKHSNSVISSHRASVHLTGFPSRSTDPSPIPGLSIDEFGVMENGDSQIFNTTSGTAGLRQSSVRASPSRGPRQMSTTSNSTPGSLLQRKSKRDSVSFTGFRKSSTGSVASIVSIAPSDSHRRFSALSPSKLLTPKMSLPTTRVVNASTGQNIHQTIASPSSSRQSLSTPSPVPSSVDEEELLGDEEMIHYIRRQQAKKIASGATQEELDDLLRFPEPLSPRTPWTPAGESFFPLSS